MSDINTEQSLQSKSALKKEKKNSDANLAGNPRGHGPIPNLELPSKTPSGGSAFFSDKHPAFVPRGLFFIELFL